MWIAIQNAVGARQGVGGGPGPGPGPGYTPPLDDYPNAAAAYSVRLLRTAYSGSALRVRRNAAPFDEQDIGFTPSGDLDEADIVAFGGSDVLTVSAWYDQSSNANNATQITPGSQPQIYNGTAVLTENGKPALSCDTGSATYLLSGSNVRGASDDFSVFSVGQTQSNYSYFWSLGNSNSNREGFARRDGTNTLYCLLGSSQITATSATLASQRLHTYTRGGLSSDSIDIRIDSSAVTISGANSTTQSLLASQLYLGSYYNGSLNCTGTFQEYVVYASDQSSPTDNRTGIETNINDYFSIYTEYNPDAPTSGFLFDYSGASVAYSVRQLNDNATFAMRVRRNAAPFDEQDIRFDSNGDLDTAAISTFGGSDVLTVSAWYDQSGNQVHATQITPSTQPQIYDGAAVFTNNGKPEIKVGPGAFTTSITSVSQPFSVSSVLSASGLFARFLGSNSDLHIIGANSFLWLDVEVGAGITTAQNRQTGFFGVGNGSSGSGKVYDSTAQPTAVSINTTETISLSVFAARADINTGNNRTKIQEFILWESDETSNRTGIETNINDHFDIYT